MFSLLDFTFLTFRPCTSLGRGNSLESQLPNRDVLPLSLETDGCLYKSEYFIEDDEITNIKNDLF